MINPSTVNDDMRSYIQRVATGPELSKSLSRAEAKQGMRHILEQAADPVQAAIYLIGLRMKRETDDENAGILDALLTSVKHHSVNVDHLIEIADPYDGFVRGTPASSFLPAVLAALGVPAVITGAYAVGPKYGVTHNMILAAAGIDVSKSPSDVAGQVEAFGWGYVDQAQFIPDLSQLLELRTRMVKRTVITTLEVLLHPIQARATHLMTGYVHKPYPPRYLRLARQAGYASAMIVRGVEGGVVPSLSQPSKYHRFMLDGLDEEVRLDPAELTIEQRARIQPLPENADHREPEGQPFASINSEAVARHGANLGMKALQNQQGAFRDSLIYGASICLHHLGRTSNFALAASEVRKVLDNGSAWERFQDAL
ncbi:MAG: anthranilate phosphoribosyltransferase [Parasphingorhabdus sp.]|jgi:anthranilate phosphoribosyltransferase